MDRGRETLPIEAKYRTLARPGIPRSFAGFLEKYKPKKAVILNKNLKEKVSCNNCEIAFMTLWDFILDDDLFGAAGSKGILK